MKFICCAIPKAEGLTCIQARRPSLFHYVIDKKYKKALCADLFSYYHLPGCRSSILGQGVVVHAIAWQVVVFDQNLMMTFIKALTDGFDHSTRYVMDAQGSFTLTQNGATATRKMVVTK